MWPDFLSGQHISAYIRQYLPDTKTPITVQDLIDYCKSKEENFIVYMDFPVSGGKAVYLSGDTSFKPEIVEGRSFIREDFEKQMPVAIISDYEWLIDKCIIKNGKEYFPHENNEYEVIGKFKSQPYRQYIEEQNIDNYHPVYDALYFVNMAASFDTNLHAPLNGYYAIDAKGKSSEFVEGFESLAREINPDIQINAEEIVITNNTQKFLLAIGSSRYLLIVFAITAFLILLNISSITNYWIEGRKKEISVRMLSGGKSSTIRNMMLRDYLLIVSTGYGIGLFLSIVASNLAIFSFIVRTIYPVAVIYGYIVCLIIGMISGFISLEIKLKRNIILQIRE